MQIWSEETVHQWRTHYNDAASAWGKWADQLAEQQDKINRAILAAADATTGTHLLDLASGAGEPALTAARLVGPQGRVMATDVSDRMVAILQERIRKHGLENIECQQADMEALPFADCTFDAVTCRYGLMYARDPALAVAEAARVTRPSGRIAYMVWGPEHNNTVVFHGIRTANEALGKPIPEEDFAAPTRFCDTSVVAALLESAGLERVTERDLVLEPRIRVGVPFWTPLLEMNAGHVWSSLTPAEQERTHQAIAQSYEAFRKEDHYVLKTHMKIISAMRPMTSTAV